MVFYLEQLWGVDREELTTLAELQHDPEVLNVLCLEARIAQFFGIAV
jgi:hypothetical protein